MQSPGGVPGGKAGSPAATTAMAVVNVMFATVVVQPSLTMVGAQGMSRQRMAVNRFGIDLPAASCLVGHDMTHHVAGMLPAEKAESAVSAAPRDEKHCLMNHPAPAPAISS
jgi:hypothetical protein